MEPVTALELTGFRPAGMQPGRLSVLIDGSEAAKGRAAPGQFSLSVPLRGRLTRTFDVEVRFDGPTAPGSAGDERNLAWVLLSFSARHAGVSFAR
jgi:hypothetical protein